MALSIGTHTSNLTESALSRTVVTGSAMIYGLMDFNATNPPGKTPLTGSGVATERLDQGDSTGYAQWLADWVPTAPGTFSFGPNNYTSLAVAQVILEVLSSAGAASIVQWAQVSDWFSKQANNGTKTVTGLSWNTGDVIVVIGGVEVGNNGGAGANLVVPTNANLTFGAVLEAPGANTTTEATCRLYACVAGSTQSSQTITSTLTNPSGSLLGSGIAVWVISEVPVPLVITPAGSGNSASSTTTLAFDCGDSFAIGDIIAVAISADNNGTLGVSSLSSVADAGGNVYELLQATYDPGAAAAGQTVGLAWARITTALVTTDDVTITFSPATVAKAAVVWKLHPDSGTVIQKVTSGFGAGSATGTPTITTSTINTGDVVVAALAVESNEAVTADADTTNGNWAAQATATGNTGTVATSSRIASQTKIVTATATQTYNPTMTSRDCIDGWITFTPAFIRPNVQVLPSQSVHRSRNW